MCSVAMYLNNSNGPYTVQYTTKFNRNLQEVIGGLQFFDFLFSLSHPFLVFLTPRCLHLETKHHKEYKMQQNDYLSSDFFTIPCVLKRTCEHV